MNRQWAKQAACANVSSDVVYSDATHHVEAMLRTCATCPVADECLTDALTEPTDDFVRGGYTSSQRYRMRGGTHTCTKCGHPFIPTRGSERVQRLCASPDCKAARHNEASRNYHHRHATR